MAEMARENLDFSIMKIPPTYEGIQEKQTVAERSIFIVPFHSFDMSTDPRGFTFIRL